MKYTFFFAALLLGLVVNAQTTFYVSPTGKDGNVGTKAKPFATIAKARNELRKLGDKKQGSTVIVRGGIYNFTEPFELTEQDGGSKENPVTYKAADNEQVIFTGGIAIPSASFKTIKDPATLARIAPELQDKIVCLDLNTLHLNHTKILPDLFDDDGGILGLFINGDRMPMSRYPNKGYMAMKKVIINGGGQEAKTDDWANYYGAGSKEKRPPRPGVFEYRDNRAARWINQLDRGVWVKGYWRIPWENECVRVAAIDTTAHTITLKKPVPGGIGNKYTRPAGNGREQYWLIKRRKKTRAQAIRV